MVREGMWKLIYEGQYVLICSKYVFLEGVFQEDLTESKSHSFSYIALPIWQHCNFCIFMLSFRAQHRVSPYCHLLTTELNPHPLRRRCSISFLNCRLREPTSLPSCLQEAYTSDGPSQPHPLRHKMKDPEMTMSRRVNLAVVQAKRALNVVKMGLLPP